jgi:hypothetical protein
MEISTCIDRAKSEGVLHRVKTETMHVLVTSCIGTAYYNTLLKEG